jgi:hypothetical protein
VRGSRSVPGKAPFPDGRGLGRGFSTPPAAARHASRDARPDTAPNAASPAWGHRTNGVRANRGI